MPLVLDGTNGVSGVDGTASNPAIEGTDSNTGIFYPAADTVAIGTGGTEALRVNSSQNVGIGTSSPSGILHTYKSNAVNYFESPGISSVALQFVTNNVNRYRIGIPSGSNDLQFLAGGTTETMRLDSSGNVGIGTTSPAVTLHLKAAVCNVRLEDADTSAYANVGVDNSGSMYLQADPANSQANTAIYFATDGTERARITSGGDLLLNSTNATTATMTIMARSGGSAVGFRRNSSTYGSDTQVGSISCDSTSTAYNTSSDYRLKENIQPMTGALTKLAALKPCTYTWKEGGSDGEGFIAHELQEIVPQCVTGEKDAVDAEGNPIYQGVDTSFLVATLTAAIQELNAKVEALEAQLKGNA